jgi:hypothetical protein
MMNSSNHVYYVIIFKQQRQCTHNLTLKSVRGTTVTVEKHKYDEK